MRAEWRWIHSHCSAHKKSMWSLRTTDWNWTIIVHRTIRKIGGERERARDLKWIARVIRFVHVHSFCLLLYCHSLQHSHPLTRFSTHIKTHTHTHTPRRCFWFDSNVCVALSTQLLLERSVLHSYSNGSFNSAFVKCRRSRRFSGSLHSLRIDLIVCVVRSQYFSHCISFNRPTHKKKQLRWMY